MAATTAIEKSAAVEPAPSTDGKRLSVEEKGDVVELAGSYTEEEERRVLRKIDYTILPMMCFIFFLQYLDKQTLSYASVSLSRSLFIIHWRELASYCTRSLDSSQISA